MADPRRSARSTKGVNSRLSEINVLEIPTPAPKRRKSTPKTPQPEEDDDDDDDPSSDGEDKPDDIIRCVCGASEEDEDDERMMIQCEGCDAWQHTQCMGITKKKIPNQYFCELCRPEQHTFLLEAMKLGEKPWEKRHGGKRRKSAAATATTTTQAAAAKQKEAVPAKPKKQQHKASSPATADKGKPAATPAKGNKAAAAAATAVAVAEAVAAEAAKNARAAAAAAAAAKVKAALAAKPKSTPAKKKAASSEKGRKDRKERKERKERKPAAQASPASEPAPSPAPAPAETTPQSPAPEPKPEVQAEPIALDPQLEGSAPHEDRMDVDLAEPQSPTAGSTAGSPARPPEPPLDRMDRDATIPAEDMPPPPPPPPATTPTPTAPAPAAAEKKRNNRKSLPPIVTEPPSPSQKPKARKDSSEAAVSTPPVVVGTPKPGKRKQSHDSDGEYHAEEKEPQHTEKKQRRASTVASTPETPKPPPPPPPKQDRRKPSATPVPKQSKKAKEDTTPQEELVSEVAELRNSNRQNVVRLLISFMLDHARRLVDEKKITLQPGSTVESLCENRALQIEHHVYMNHFDGGQIGPEYRARSRSIGRNLKSNSALSDEILGGRLSCERLSHMTTEEMASKELKELTQQVRLESEKQNTLINETGPRIRRTHKGEELVGEDASGTSGQDTLLESGAVIRRASDVVMEELPAPTPASRSGTAPAQAPAAAAAPTPAPAAAAPAAPDTPAQTESPAQPAEPSMSPSTTCAATSSETPRSPSQALPAAAAETSAPPPPPPQPAEKKERSFNIENVWSQVEAPDTERRPPRPSARPPATPAAAPARPADAKIDKDIDMLLKDEDPDAGTPPYSPASYDDHYSPKPNQDDDTVWRGRIEMNQIASLTATASLLGGPDRLGDKQWFELLDPVLNIDGRIKHDRATEYLCGQKFSKSSSMVLASLRPDHSASQAQFDKLFEYFKFKERYAVVGKHHLPCIKDLYIVPIDASETLPDWFNVVDPPSKVPEKNRSSRMLVLIFVIIRSLVSGHVENANGAPVRRRFSMPDPELAGTARQPRPSPYSPAHPHMPPSPYQNSPLAPQQPPYSHYASHPYTYHQQQQQQQPQQPHPHPLPPLQGPQQYASPPQPQHPHPISPHLQGSPPGYPSQSTPPPLPPLPLHGPLPQESPPRMTYVPKHSMTRELIGLVPRLRENQVMAIDKLLQENPQLTSMPGELSKEVEKVLGAEA